MRRALFASALILTALLLGGSVAYMQDPINQRPLSSLGLTAGVGYGTTEPTLANNGRNPHDGELFVVRNEGTAEPKLEVYSQFGSQWLSALASPADQVTTFLDDTAGSYYGLAVPQSTATGSQLWFPAASGIFAGAASAEDALASDLQMVCYRAYLPFPMTATEFVFYEFAVTTPGATDFLGFAIYEDLDAGTQLTEGATVFAADGAALVIDITDVTLKPGFYRFCGCQNDVSAQDWLAVAPEATVQAINDDTVASESAYAIAANACTGNADAPATTGALTATAEALFVGRLQSN